MKIFVDMDGVLADFDAHYAASFGTPPDKKLDNVDWDKVRSIPGFYRNLPPMADLGELWDFVGRFNPIVLTGVPSSIAEAADDKRAWAAKWIGDSVEVRCCRSKDKSLHASPGDILIDDWDRYRGLWIAKGGRWITHTSAADSIDRLLAMGIGL